MIYEMTYDEKIYYISVLIMILSIIGVILATLMTCSERPWLIGKAIVKFSARFLLNKKYHIIKNTSVSTEDVVAQIDHIIVSKFGVFVVETNKTGGIIWGSPSEKTWSYDDLFYCSGEFQNPLYDSYKHVKIIESLLGLDSHQVHSVVAFLCGISFRIKPADDSDSVHIAVWKKAEMPENIVTSTGYLKYIKSKEIPIISEPQVTEILKAVKQGRLTPLFKTNREHGAMTLRESKKGQSINNKYKFRGCKNFPRCRGFKDANKSSENKNKPR